MEHPARLSLMRPARRLVTMLLALLALFPAASQEETYFALSTNRSFGPGEKVEIGLSGSVSGQLELRLYRVNDPVKFFLQLGDPHNFGGVAPRPPRRRTFLERLELERRAARMGFRNLIRRQFSPEYRARIRSFLEPSRPASSQPAVTRYAEVPLLNQEQLVATWKENIPSSDAWVTHSIPVPVPGKGLFLVEAVHQGLRAYTIVSVTDLVLVTKSSPGSLLLYAADRAQGAPLPDTAVEAWLGSQRLPAVRTASDGLAEIPVQAASSTDDLLLLARHRDDFAVHGLYTWNLRSDLAAAFTGYVYTDRPVYRPGHTVNFKAILRGQSPEGFALPNISSVRLEIQDPDGQIVSRQRLSLSRFGTVHGRFTLPEKAALGYYYLNFQAGEASTGGGFYVEEYRKPEYDVRITPTRSRYLQGEEIEAEIRARYYYGEPVREAKVTYTVTPRRALFFDEEDADAEGAQDSLDDSGEEGAAAEQTGALDADGVLRIRIPTRRHEFDMIYVIEARVRDAANREISSRRALLTTIGNFRLQIEPSSYVYSSGDPVRLNVTALTYDNQPVATPFTVELRQWRWDSGQKLGALLSTASGQTGADGSGAVTFPSAPAGTLQVRALAFTPQGRTLITETYLWVAGAGSQFARQEEILRLVPDRKAYAPGQTAKILIPHGAPGAKLLVTVEGAKLYSRQILTANGPTSTVSVPILKEHQPGVFVSASLLRQGVLISGSKRLNVPPKEREINVQLVAGKEQFLPGEPAEFRLTARDHTGAPVAGEFSIGVVDEAIYAIRPDAAQDILKFFYGQPLHRVSTDSSLAYFFRGEAGRRPIPLAAHRRPSRLAQLKPEPLAQPKIRKAFPDTALWIADLVTGSDGRAVAKLEFPDSLTTWRATARGVTTDTRVGSAIARTIVRKNLILTLATPRFLMRGDEVTIPAIVRNYWKEEKRVKVSLEAKGVTVTSPASQEITVPADGEAKINFSVRTADAREAVFLAKALSTGESDALEIPLPVLSYGVPLSEARSGALAAETETTFELRFPNDAEKLSRTLEISVTPSVAGSLFGALDYLTSFPYGCVEQTMSSFLPNVVVARAVRELGLPLDLNHDELNRKINAGLERLIDMQHSDGGWGWWKSDESQIFMTAYVVAGLAELAEQDSRAGAPMERGAAWLEPQLRQDPRLAADLRAYSLYALARANRKPMWLADDIWNRRAELSPYGLALYGLAMEALGRPERADNALRTLLSQAQTQGETAYWPADYDNLMGFATDAGAEATAMAVKLIARRQPSHPLLSQAALWLIRNRDRGNYWYSTKRTAIVVYGLTDYLKASKELDASFTATVWVNDKEVFERKFSPGDALSPDIPKVRLLEEQLSPGVNRIRIRRSGAGTLHWSAKADYFSPFERQVKTGEKALSLEREYFRLVPDSSSGKLVYQLAPLTGDVRPGDTLAVRLTVSSGPLDYLLVEDPIPAGTEIVTRQQSYPLAAPPPWWTLYWERREYRDDRAAFFQTFSREGRTEYVYLLKVVNPGRFRIPPARVQPMYQPDWLATTGGLTLEVKP